MNIEQFREYCLAKKHVTESFPFDAHTLVFKVAGKIFTIAPLERKPAQANLKCDPERAEELREQYDGVIIPGYHMSKKHWNTVLLEGIPNKLLIELIEHSYELIVSSLTKKKREEFGFN